MERLPVVGIATDALQRYWQHFADLLRVIALPALAHAAIVYVWHGGGVQAKWLALAIWLAQGLVMTLAALSCHRVILLGSESVPHLGVHGTTSRDWRFVWTASVLYVVTQVLVQLSSAAVFIPLSLLNPDLVKSDNEVKRILVLLTTLPGLYVTARLAIQLPSVATDRALSIKDAWQITRGQGLRLLLLIVGLPWTLHIAQRALARTFTADADYVTVATLLFWLLLPLEIALLSLCYQRMSRSA